MIKCKHKLTGEILTIKKINGSVATCYINEPYYLPNTWVLIDTVVCSMDNLIF